MKAAFIFIYIWFLSFFFKSPEPKPCKQFVYSKSMYDFEFESQYVYSFRQTLQIVKDLIKICTNNGVIENGQSGYDYIKSIHDFSEKHKLSDKNENRKELTQWLHYYDENKKDWFHFDEQLVMYYLEQANTLLGIYKHNDQLLSEVASLQDLLEHIDNSVKCIESYINFTQVKYQ